MLAICNCFIWAFIYLRYLYWYIISLFSPRAILIWSSPIIQELNHCLVIPRCRSSKNVSNLNTRSNLMWFFFVLIVCPWILTFNRPLILPLSFIVYNEVENRIASFREMLNNRLLQLPSSVDEQKRLIR